MDPGEEWFSRTFFDSGELGAVFSGTLELGECPQNAVYFDSIYADWKLNPSIKQRAACRYERPAGLMAWRHEGSSAIETRQARGLVLRNIGVAGNYDYNLDWIFQPDGTLRVRVGATGEANAEEVRSRTAAEHPAGEASHHGRLIGETYVGMDHDHFFSFRLDFDLDGTANCFLREKLQLQHLPAETFRNSVRVAKPDVAKTQGQAKAHRSMDNPESWLVANPNVKNCLGDPVGYARMGGENPMSLMLTEDYSQRRAGFTDDPI